VTPGAVRARTPSRFSAGGALRRSIDRVEEAVVPALTSSTAAGR
jgi:hypothetical protein